MPGMLSRSQARLATVQALYQMDLAETDLVEVIEEFKQHRLGGSGDGSGMAEADQEHFAQVLRGVVKRQRDIDPLIDQQLATGWRLARIELYRARDPARGAFELIELPDVPARVVISEYIEVAHAFFEGDEPSSSMACSISSRASYGPGRCPSAAEAQGLAGYSAASPRGA